MAQVPIPINDISQLTLKTKQISIDSGDFDIVLNFSDILRTDIVYINATSFLKKKTDKKIRVEDYLILKATKSLITAIEEDQFKSGVLPTFKKGVYYRKSGRYGGTWMCKLLFLDFARWVNPAFSVVCNRILLQVFAQASELSESRKQLRAITRPLNDIIKNYLIDTGLKNDSAYTQFAVQIKRFVGAPDERDTYTKHQLDTAKSICDEYRAMMVHGGKTSLGEMNRYLKDTKLNLAWEHKKLLKGE